MTDTDTPDVLADRRYAEFERLESENARLKAQRDALAAALRNLLHDTGYGVFVQGYSAVRQAEEALALLADEYGRG